MGAGCHPIIYGFGGWFEIPNTERFVEASDPEGTRPPSVLQLGEVARIEMLAECEYRIPSEITG